MAIPKIEAFEEEKASITPKKNTSQKTTVVSTSSSTSFFSATDAQELTTEQKAGRFFIGLVGWYVLSFVLGFVALPFVYTSYVFGYVASILIKILAFIILLWWLWNRRRWIAYGMIGSIILGILFFLTALFGIYYFGGIF